MAQPTITTFQPLSLRLVLMTAVALLVAALVGWSPAVAEETEAPSNPRVALETTLGTIVVELDAARAPLSTENFLSYVKNGFYNGTVFHRVIKDFMIQGGGFDVGYDKKITSAAIQNEADNGLSNVRGTIAMARTPDPHSATAQFYINHGDNSQSLDHMEKSAQGWGYAVFGQVVEGMAVVDAIAETKTAPRGPHRNAPTEDVVITSAKVVE